jgi:ParB family chromosome partitioning protein
MSTRIEKMLAKTAGVRAVKDIPASEVPQQIIPKTAVGTMAAWQAAQLRIQELEASGASLNVSVASISPNPWQPRRVFDSVEIQKLAESIDSVGLIQPITIRRKSVSKVDTFSMDGQSMESVSKVDTFELIAGERRLRAHQLLNILDIKAVIVAASDEDMALMSLAENIDRTDLTDYEISKAILQVQSQFKSVKKLAETIGVVRTDLYRYLDFANLPAFVTADLDKNPALLGRAAVSAIVRTLKEHGSKGEECLQAIWSKVKSGTLDQGKIAPSIATAITRGDHAKSDRDIKKLFIGKEQAGSITRDAASLTVKIRAAALTPEREIEIRSLIERIFQ